MAAALLIPAASAAEGPLGAAVLDGVRLENAVWIRNGTPWLSADVFCAAAGIRIQPASSAQGCTLARGSQQVTVPLQPPFFIPAGGGASRLFLPAAQLAKVFGYTMTFDAGSGTLTLSVPKPEMPSGVRLPILMYHAVSDKPWSGNTGLFVRPSELEAKVKWLLDHGYDPITFEDLTSLDQYDKPVLLTFDDGYDDNYTEALRILQKYGVKATFFVVGWHFDSPHCMDEEMLRKAAATGLISIQSHTLTHPDLRELSEEELHHEFSVTNALIKEITGKDPVALAYPTGYNNKRVRTVAAEYYQYAVLMGGEAPVTGKTDPLRWHRIYVPRGMSISDFSYKVRTQ